MTFNPLLETDDSSSQDSLLARSSRTTKPYDSLRRQLCAYGFVAIEFNSFPNCEVPADWLPLSKRTARIWCHPHFYRGASDWSKVPRKRSPQQQRPRRAQPCTSGNGIGSTSTVVPVKKPISRKNMGIKQTKVSILDINSNDGGKTKIKYSTAAKWINMERPSNEATLDSSDNDTSGSVDSSWQDAVFKALSEPYSSPSTVSSCSTRADSTLLQCTQSGTLSNVSPLSLHSALPLSSQILAQPLLTIPSVPVPQYFPVDWSNPLTTLLPPLPAPLPRETQISIPLVPLPPYPLTHLPVAPPSLCSFNNFPIAPDTSMPSLLAAPLRIEGLNTTAALSHSGQAATTNAAIATSSLLAFTDVGRIHFSPFS